MNENINRHTCKIILVWVDGYLFLPFFLSSGPSLQHSSLQSSLGQSVVEHLLIHSGKSSLQGASANEIKKCYYLKYNEPRFNRMVFYTKAIITKYGFLIIPSCPTPPPTILSTSTRRYFALENLIMTRNPRVSIRICTFFILDWCKKLFFWIKLSILGRRLWC